MSRIMTDQAPDIRTDFFADRMQTMLSEASAALMVSIGHRCGLFSAVSRLDWFSAENLSTSTGLSERFLCSWLDCLSAAGILECDAENGTYRLPRQHAAVLTDGGAVANMASQMQQVAMLAGVEGLVADSFRHRQGVHPLTYTRFQEINGAVSRDGATDSLESIISLAPGMQGKLERGVAVLEVGCGSGELLTALARRFPRSRFRGIDISDKAIRLARKLQLRSCCPNLEFEQCSMLSQPEAMQYDLVLACNVVRNCSDSEAMLSAIHLSLRIDGLLVMCESQTSPDSHRTGKDRLEAYHHAYECMVSLPQALALGGGRANAFPDDAELGGMLTRIGFSKPRPAPGRKWTGLRWSVASRQSKPLPGKLPWHQLQSIHSMPV